jgi:hypothetical protein
MTNRDYIFRWNPNTSFPTKNPSHANKLKSLFKAWNNLLEEYELAWRKYKEIPYVDNEQAEVSLLAIAARDTKGLPLMEVSKQKHEQKADYSGRVDLEIYWTMKLDWCLGIEAKKVFISCSPRRKDKDYVQTIKSPLDEAGKCVKTIEKSYIDSMALVIGILSQASEDFDEKRFCIDIFSAAWKIKADFCSIHFCEEDIWKNSNFKRYPGIALIGKMYGKRAS